MRPHHDRKEQRVRIAAALGVHAGQACCCPSASGRPVGMAVL